MAEGKKVGSIYIDLGMKADTFSKGLAKAEGAMRSFGTKIKSGLNALRNFIFSWKTLVVGALVAAFTGKAIGGIKSLVRGVIDASNTYEQLRLTLKVLLKDQNKANKAFAEAEELAAKTAFSIEEVTRGYTSLLVFGFDQTKIPETLLLAADAASAFGQNLDEVIRALSYLKAGRKGEALESLARFGISRTELVKRGASFSAGGELETDTEKLFAIIESIWGDTVKGMSVEGAKTWKGMISNLGDAWVKFNASIGEAGFFDMIKLKLKGILDIIAMWAKDGTLAIWAEKLSTVMSRTLNGVWFIIKNITGLGEGKDTQNTGRIPPWASTVLEWINKIKAAIQDMWANFSSAWKGKDLRGSAEGHGILPGGFEGIGIQIVKSIEAALKTIDWSGMLESIGKNTAQLTKIGITMGKALGNGIEEGLADDHPILTWLWKAGRVGVDITTMGAIPATEWALDRFNQR